MTGAIESYGLIGDCETAALVGRDGSIDWLCWPRFDSDSTFAALVGDTDNGRWLLAPLGGGEAVSRRYRGDTLILETDFEDGNGGAVTLIDFMPPRGTNSDIVRLVRGVRGTIKMRMELVIRFGYGRIVPWVRKVQDDGGAAVLAVGGPDMVVLRTPVETHGQDSRTIGEFEVSEGEQIPFVLTYGPSFRAVPDPIDVDQALAETESFWSEWASRSRGQLNLDWRLGKRAEDAAVRSLITLKALTYAPTGGIVAAPTTSLPELVGGARNWDYRFCWLRDATLTLIALMDAGYYDEAQAWRDWLLRAVAGNPEQIQIMYGITGERRLSEWSVPWLGGYGHSKPVRIGNAAHGQLQTDVFGELMDALYQARKGGIPENDAAWALQQALIDHLERVWGKPDHGIWEIRSGLRHFTYSKIMAWVAVDRCIRSVEEFGLHGPVDRWRAMRDAIYADVCTNGYDASRNTFVQSYGARPLDASLLLIPTLGFLPASDPRFRGTVEAIEKDLMANGFVRRYDTGESEDGVGGGEGAFLACSFWLADAFTMIGRRGDAEALFERLLDVRNELGLLAEEYDPVARRHLGNFPQAFSHLALIRTAQRLAHFEQPEERKPADAAQ